MQRFSERHGYSKVRASIQFESMDNALRNSLWNVLQSLIWDTHRSQSNYSYTKSSNLYPYMKAYWSDYFKEPTDKIPRDILGTIATIRTYFMGTHWYGVYDFMEFTCGLMFRRVPDFGDRCNVVLEREASAYRFVDGKICPITSEIEIEEIENAVERTAGIVGANTHLRRSLELLSDRQSPDYRNSIKEAISAVESMAKAIVANDGATLGEALKVMSTRAVMHPALNKGLSSLYGYTSSSSGIRHALLQEETLDFVDAKFMLVACSAFVNYMAAKVGALDV